MTMTTYTITRSGLRDLTFAGEILASASDRRVAGKEKTRWQEITLYALERGGYLLQNEYLTLWQGEFGSSSATVCETARDVLDKLEHIGGGLSDLAKELLQEAARKDASFENIWVERLEDEEVC